MVWTDKCKWTFNLFHPMVAFPSRRSRYAWRDNARKRLTPLFAYPAHTHLAHECESLKWCHAVSETLCHCDAKFHQSKILCYFFFPSSIISFRGGKAALFPSSRAVFSLIYSLICFLNYSNLRRSSVI